MEGFMRLSSYFKTISQILIFAMLHLCWLTSYGYAEMVPTESAAQAQDDRQRLLDLLDRQEVIDELEKYGISKVEATARINSLNDEEVTMIAGKLDELPEGQFMGGVIILFGVPIALMILYFTFYIAFLPIAAGVCIFVEGPYSECIEDYWEFFFDEGTLFNEKEEVKENKEEVDGCIRKCDGPWVECIESVEDDEFPLPTNHQCNLDYADCLKICQKGEEKEEIKENKEEGSWCQNPDTNEYVLCEEQQSGEEDKLKGKLMGIFPAELKEGQKWCQHPDTNEYYPCEVKENKVEEFLEEKEKCKEGEQWFQNPDTNEWLICKEQQP
jgi:uncharacterized protein DUF6627